MSYSVQFVGLVCFYREREGLQALLPDGRDPGPGIDPHYASIRVSPADVLEASGWTDEELATPGTFPLVPCFIDFEGAQESGALDTSDHDGKLLQLRQLDRNMDIDPELAQTIARVRLRNGRLAAYAIPGGEAAISQLDVPHDGSIHVTITPQDGSGLRTITLKPGTEIALANMAQHGYTEDVEYENHFQIYSRLSTRAVTLPDPETIPAVPPSPSHHALFTRNAAIGLAIGCTNTGCC
jgi:hypothetical protein